MSFRDRIEYLDEHSNAIITGSEIVGVTGSVLIGQPELVPGILAAGETARTAASYLHAGSEILDYGNAVDAINAHNMDRSHSLSSGLGKRPTPSDSARETPVLQHTTHSQNTPSTPSDGYSIRGSQVSAITNGLSSDLSYFDSHLVQGPCETTLTRLNVKIGKQVYPDVITPFLANLNAKGKVVTQFAGRILSATNERHVHFQNFRHRLSATNDNVDAEYPDGTLGYILKADNPVTAFAIAGGTTTAGYAANTTSFRDMLKGTTYWAPYNKADLEDCSWNLNALKLDKTGWASPSQPEFVTVNVPMLQTNKHSRTSMIDFNNRAAAAVPTGTPSTSIGPASYKYNAVFNHGSVVYTFMNKGLGGAKVEMIVYRLKKTKSINIAGASYGTTPTVLNTQVYAAIGQGYLDTVLAKGGTDAVGGRTPLASDVVSNPAFPFLPKLKKTVGMSMPFAEISRQTFAMPSGSRRVVNIVLPGDVYDPTGGQSSGVFPLAYPNIIDPGTFIIVIGVHGTKCTQDVAKDQVPNTRYPVGDMYSGANIQFYATYTEHLGACQYKNRGEQNMYSQGALKQSLPPSGYTATPVTMLPQQSAVRIGPSSVNNSVTSQNTLSHTYDATPIP